MSALKGSTKHGTAAVPQPAHTSSIYGEIPNFSDLISSMISPNFAEAFWQLQYNKRLWECCQSLRSCVLPPWFCMVLLLVGVSYISRIRHLSCRGSSHAPRRYSMHFCTLQPIRPCITDVDLHTSKFPRSSQSYAAKSGLGRTCMLWKSLEGLSCDVA